MKEAGAHHRNSARDNNEADYQELIRNVRVESGKEEGKLLVEQCRVQLCTRQEINEQSSLKDRVA